MISSSDRQLWIQGSSFTALEDISGSNWKVHSMMCWGSYNIQQLHSLLKASLLDHWTVWTVYNKSILHRQQQKEVCLLNSNDTNCKKTENKANYWILIRESPYWWWKGICLAMGCTRNGEDVCWTISGEGERRSMCCWKVTGEEVVGEPQQGLVSSAATLGENSWGRMCWGSAAGVGDELFWFIPCCCGKGGR